MGGLDILAIGVVAFLVVVILAAVIYLLILPGWLARRNGHPQAQAITWCGVMGLFTAGIAWVVALVWALSKPQAGPELELTQSQAQELATMLAAISERTSRLEAEVKALS
jgi:type VI protein secretion system component VasK